MIHPFELVLPVGGADHILGPAHAPVTVVEYGDFECPNCKQAVPAEKLLLQRFHGRVRFVYRHFPLEAVHPTRWVCSPGQGLARRALRYFEKSRASGG